MLVCADSPNPWNFVGQVCSDGPSMPRAFLDTAEEWLGVCIDGHARCMTSEESLLPTRVIDVGQPGCNIITMLETQGLKGQYICLSYCWGKIPFTRTTAANLEARKTGIKISEMCQTFQDVVHVVRALKARYIWVDALCIIQEDAEDWDREAGCMAAYYRNAYLTIAATWGDPATQGLFPPTKSGIRIESVEILPSTEQFQGKASTAYQQGSDVIQLPMLTRAWYFQERLSSTRVLHFARNELIWKCRESLTCECSQVRYSPKPGFCDSVSHMTAKITGHDTWRRLVSKYTALSLSFEDYRLPALGGLADEMAVTASTYLAGFWHASFIADTCWYRPAGLRRNPQTSLSSTSYRASPWSWASVQGPVEYNEKLLSGDHRFDGGTRVE
ncbi:heterokaryon incompatibility protein-domain-containing protein [Phaeosphaeriaceae sp. PMI808]|nr:heterokaryon incompatibility protein-domain-containing protein [Phaeosphaeriaceae sp. PMI808]